MRRPLLLNGFMATGKSSVGRALASRVNHPFIDLDERIEARAGASVSEIFAQHGEAAFRSLERAELAAVLNDPGPRPPVVALGGGALTRRDSRLDALDRAVVVTLQASAEEIARRASVNADRPLLQGADPVERARELLAQRAAGYAEAHARIATEGRSIDAVASDALSAWELDALVVAAGERSYVVEIGAGILASRLAAAVGNPSRLLLVTDSNVLRLHGASALSLLSALNPAVVELAPGEEHKHIGSAERIWRAALEASADRKARVLAFGGGVVTDVAGFAAASYMRGISWVGAPTTLLAMVDASVGGKTGVDLLTAKNAVGAFWQPSRVLCDTELLKTESDRAFRSALAEVVKTALIGDPDLLDLLESTVGRIAERPSELLVELVRRSIRVKARIVSEDERESGRRALLNLGHTVGHALEAVSGYSRLTHGEAVSLGLVAALRIGVGLGVTPPALAERAEALLARLCLPTDIASEPLEASLQLIGHDKKRAGRHVRFIVAKAAGDVGMLDLELSSLQSLTLSLAQRSA
jgi:shikimate kinase/3-dehydroquinate synthase